MISYPRTQLISIFEGEPSKTRPFPIKTRVIWVLGIYYIHYILSFEKYPFFGKNGGCSTFGNNPKRCIPIWLAISTPWTHISQLGSFPQISNGKCGYPWGSTLNLYHHVYTIYISIYGIHKVYQGVFREQTARVLSQGYPPFPIESRDT